jgi:DNA-binding response OmpR family regulator
LYLENSDFEIITHESGKWATQLILSQAPDLVILDINLPVYDGIEVCKQVRITSQVPIIMLTARGWEIDRVTWLESGADDYIAKPFSPRELLARIQSILRRSNWSQQEENSNVISFQNIKIFRDKSELQVDWNIVGVTKNEYDIMEKIFLEDWKLVSRESLMKEVIWYDNYVYDRTIDTHIKNLRKKLWWWELILTVRWKWYRLNK